MYSGADSPASGTPITFPSYGPPTNSMSTWDGSVIRAVPCHPIPWRLVGHTAQLSGSVLPRVLPSECGFDGVERIQVAGGFPQHVRPVGLLLQLGAQPLDRGSHFGERHAVLAVPAHELLKLVDPVCGRRHSSVQAGGAVGIAGATGHAEAVDQVAGRLLVATQGATRPFACHAAYVTGMESSSTFSHWRAAHSISTCGLDGYAASSSRVRRLRKCMRERGLHVAYMVEYVDTGSTMRATSRAMPSPSIR